MRASQVHKITEFGRPLKVAKTLRGDDETLLRKLLVKYVAGGFNSFLSIESNHLKQLVQFGCELAAKYGTNVDLDSIWPSRNTVRNMTFEVANEYKGHISNQISDASNASALSVTTDIWSDGVVRQAYIDVSVFYVDNFELKHALLAFRHFNEAHTATAIFEKVKDIASEFGFNHLTAPYVTDSAANMKAAFRNGEWYACLCHRLHTVVKTAWDELLSSDVEIKIMFEKMINVRRSVHHSVGLDAQLPKKLPNDSPTRFWLGLSSLFRAFLTSFDKISELFEDHDVEPPTDKRLMQHALSALESFDFAFQNMQKASHPTLHLAIVNLAKLEAAIQKWPNRMKAFGEIVLRKLKQKWLSEINNGHMLAIALHPNYKSLAILNSSPILNSLKDCCKIEELISAVAESIGTDSSVARETENIQEVHNVESDPFMDVFDTQTPQTPQTQQCKFLEEYEKFVREPNTMKFENPLDYWKCSVHTHLAKVACSVFCIPCSSAEPERHNSAAGNTVTALRNRLAPELVEALVIVNEALKNVF